MALLAPVPHLEKTQPANFGRKRQTSDTHHNDDTTRRATQELGIGKRKHFHPALDTSSTSPETKYLYNTAKPQPHPPALENMLSSLVAFAALIGVLV
jgi:hypothetical protein